MHYERAQGTVLTRRLVVAASYPLTERAEVGCSRGKLSGVDTARLGQGSAWLDVGEPVPALSVKSVSSVGPRTVGRKAVRDKSIGLDALLARRYNYLSTQVDKQRTMIEFYLDMRSGVPTYLQLVQQVRQAVQLGILAPGDRLPTVKEVVGSLAINPNTVLKAYRELDREGLVTGRRGQGTFVREAVPSLPLTDVRTLRVALRRWFAQARAAGLDDQGIAALVAETMRVDASTRAA